MGFLEDRQQFYAHFNADEFASFKDRYQGLQQAQKMLDVPFQETEQILRDFIRDEGTSEKQQFIEEYLPKLGYFLQGPFPLPGQKIAPSIWDCRGKIGNWQATGVIPRLKDARALDVGCNAGYDCFLMKAFGAAEVTGFEPRGFVHHARFMNAVYETGLSFIQKGWEGLKETEYRDYDFINCQGLLYHVKNPMELISTLHKKLRSGGTLLLETHILSESSSMAQFIENSFRNDKTYWWILGDECVKGILRATGFKDVEMVTKAPAPSKNAADPFTTIQGYDAGARARFVAVKV